MANVLLIPAYNDWTALAALVPALDRCLAAEGLRAEIVVVDDGSEECVDEIAPGPLPAIDGATILRLCRNMGHQRAIAIGLCHLAEASEADVVVVMDSDGEDRPEDVVRLIRECQAQGGRRMIFAERRRRSESGTFQIGYSIYRLVYRGLTGRWIRFGNFSAVPKSRLTSLTATSGLWNHYAAAAQQSRQPASYVPADRGERLGGRSKMNFYSLVLHGLSAIAVYADVVGVRMLLASLALMALLIVGTCVATAIRFLTDLAIPGWATNAVGLMLVMLTQAVTLAVAFSFITLSNREGTSVIPIRDYRYFIAEVKRLTGPRGR